MAPSPESRKHLLSFGRNRAYALIAGYHCRTRRSHENDRHFPCRFRLRNGIACLLRHLSGARAGPARRQRRAPDRALQDHDGRRARPGRDGPPDRARSRKRQRGPHRHPGSHTIGYVLEGTYEVKVGDGPLQKLGPGETFYEPPGALHAVSRNGSSTQAVKYLVIQISDPTKPQTVAEEIFCFQVRSRPEFRARRPGWWGC